MLSPVPGDSSSTPEIETSSDFLPFAMAEVKLAAEYLFESGAAKEVVFLDHVPPDGFSFKEGTSAVDLSALQVRF